MRGFASSDYPLTFESWHQVYEWIDGAELRDTPGLREEVQKILHPEPAEQDIAPPPAAVRKREKVAPQILHPEIVLDDDRDEGAEKTHSDVERER